MIIFYNERDNGAYVRLFANGAAIDMDVILKLEIQVAGQSFNTIDHPEVVRRDGDKYAITLGAAGISPGTYGMEILAYSTDKPQGVVWGPPVKIVVRQMTGPTPTPAPVFLTQPSITGTSQVGQVLTAVDGTASNATTLTRKWYMDDAEIVGETGESYTLIAGDVGKVPGLRNFATGPGGGPVQSSLATAAAVIAGVTVPDAPVIGTATAGDGMVSVAFTAPASDGGSAILDYQVLLSTGQTASGASSPINATAPNGTPVTATVRARNAIGYGPASAPSNSVTPVAPSNVGLTDLTHLSASARVKLGSGRLVSIENAGANSATVTAYDAHGNSGRVIYTGTITTGSVVNLTDAWAVHGIYIALSGTSPSVDFLTTEI